MNPIKKYRLENGITQAELADKLGTTPHAVSQYETGKRVPNVKIGPKLSSLLGCSVEDIRQQMKEAAE